jgi:hypothetical protein
VSGQRFLYLSRADVEAVGLDLRAIIGCENAARGYVREMSEQLGLEVIGVDEPRQAVEAADLVVTSGPILKQPKPTIGRDWLRPGAFASAVDFDSSSSPAASQAGSPQPSARWRSTSASPSTTWPWRPKSCAASGPGYRSERRTRGR